MQVKPRPPSCDMPVLRQVPRALADKVKSYYDYVVEREVQADEANIIEGLSASLRTQVVLHLHSEALEKVPFFRYCATKLASSCISSMWSHQ